MMKLIFIYHSSVGHHHECNDPLMIYALWILNNILFIPALIYILIVWYKGIKGKTDVETFGDALHENILVAIVFFITSIGNFLGICGVCLMLIRSLL